MTPEEHQKAMWTFCNNQDPKDYCSAGIGYMATEYLRPEIQGFSAPAPNQWPYPHFMVSGGGIVPATYGYVIDICKKKGIPTATKQRK